MTRSRQLAAIIYIDIEGYTAIMQLIEENVIPKLFVDLFTRTGKTVFV
jgi:class 3 adenylate cyclase